jgi:hypothetical protein
LQNAYMNHYTVSSISGCLILCVISLTYIVVIDLCVLCASVVRSMGFQFTDYR